MSNTIGFIGAGQMARALARGLVQRQLVRGSAILAADCVEAARTAFGNEISEARVTDSNQQLVDAADVIFLAVKPQHLEDVLSSIDARESNALFVSIVAGVPLATLESALPKRRVVRVMPNTPCLVGEGASGFALGAAASSDDRELVNRLLSSVGMVVEVPERLLDAVTGLSGSGPAYVFAFVEALSDGGVRMGLPRTTATQLAIQTVRGAATMLQETQEHPAVLRDRVTSPAGTTIAGLQQLEQGAFRATVIAAVEAATERSQQLGSRH